MSTGMARIIVPLAVLLPQLIRGDIGEEGQCDASNGGDCSKTGVTRVVHEKTPTPCLKAYSDELVNEAAAKHLATASVDNEVPHLLVLLGGSGAGKGTFVKHAAQHGFKPDDFVFHGLDEYLVYLPEFVKSVNDPSAVYKDAADDCYGGAIAIAKKAQNDMIARRQHVMYEETGKNLDRILKRVLPPFESAGYRITTVLIDNTPNVAKTRAGFRFLQEGRYASDDYIEGTFKGVPANYRKLLETGRVHESVYCDNSCHYSPESETAGWATSRGCLRCWSDKAASRSMPELAAATQTLIPRSALEDSSVVRYLNPEAGAASSS